jgi:hypothetical protein
MNYGYFYSSDSLVNTTLSEVLDVLDVLFGNYSCLSF